MTLRLIHFGVGNDYYCDIELFRQLREFKDGITFLEGSVNLDLYKADHKPSFEITLVIFNCKICEFVIYNINHVKPKKD